jgi:hypothetical protein
MINRTTVFVAALSWIVPGAGLAQSTGTQAQQLDRLASATQSML